MKQRICQSCGMSMPTDDLLGTHGNGCLCTEYCYHCFQKGFFTNSSLEEQIELNIQPESLNAFNSVRDTFHQRRSSRRVTQILAYTQTLDAYQKTGRMGT